MTQRTKSISIFACQTATCTSRQRLYDAASGFGVPAIGSCSTVIFSFHTACCSRRLLLSRIPTVSVLLFQYCLSFFCTPSSTSPSCFSIMAHTEAETRICQFSVRHCRYNTKHVIASRVQNMHFVFLNCWMVSHQSYLLTTLVSGGLSLRS